MSLYLIHSAKGTTWSNHKYVKKVGDKYYYKDEKGNLVEGEPTDETTDSGTETTSSKSKKSTDTDRIKKLANQVMSGSLSRADLRKNGGKDYMDVMNAINAKFKKPSSSGSKSSKKETEAKEKKTSEKKTKETITEETKSTPKVETKTEEVKVEPKVESVEETKTEPAKTTETSVTEQIKDSIKSVTTVTDNDSIYATKNEDGTTTVTVDFEDGTTQTFTLAQTFDVVSKTEKTKKQLTHSIFKGNSYLIHSEM